MSKLAAPPDLPDAAPRLRLSPSRQFAILSLAILLLLGGLLAWSLSREIERQMTVAIADMIGHQVTTNIRTQISADDLREPMTGERYRAFDDFLRQYILSEQIARVKVWNEAGLIIYSDDPALVGRVFPVEGELLEMYEKGDVVAELAGLQKFENFAEQEMGPLLEIYVPIIPRDSSEALGAYEVYLYYKPIADSVRRAQVWIWESVAVALIALWACLFWVFIRASRAIAHQRQLAITDPLTGLYNRRYLLEQLELENERSQRYRTPYSLIMADIDHFKRYNDAHGHPAGDMALRELASRMRKCVRVLDTIARYGGEEFIVLLPATDLAGAARVAERIRKFVSAQPFACGPITISLGVACRDGHEQGRQTMITAADAALYQAKSLGRNKLCLAGQE